MTTSPRRLSREKLLLRYTGALERGDAATVAAVLRHAETDPDLARMIDDINAVYAAEDSAIHQFVHSPSPNGHYAQESTMTTLALPPITQRAEKQRTLPLTLVATLAAFLLLGSAMFGALLQRDQRTPAVLQAATSTTIPTDTSAKQPLRYYMETLTEVSLNISDQRQYLDYYAYTWFEAPNKYRSESYGDLNVDIAPLPYANRVAALARTTAPDSSQLTLKVQKPFQISGIVANNGESAWSYSSENPVPSWLDPQPQAVVNMATGVQQILAPTLDDLVTAFQHNYGDVQQLADDSLLGRPVYVFEIKPVHNFPYLSGEATRVVITVDQATLVQLSITAFGADETEIYKVQAVKFVPQPTIDPTLFSFALPAQTPVTVLPDWRAKNQQLIWASRADQADFDMYALTADAAFTQKNLVPSEFYLDSFGRSSLQYYHTASALFDTPALALWIGNISTNQVTNSLPGQMEPTQITEAFRNVDLNGVKAYMGKVGHFPLLNKSLWTMSSDNPYTNNFYRIFWTVGDTVLVITADSTKLTEQDVIDLAGMVSYVPTMLTSKQLAAAWQMVVDENPNAPKAYKPTLFDDNVSDGVQQESRYSAHIPPVVQNDAQAVKAARSAIDKLIPTAPAWQDGGLVQRFHSSQHRGIALVITQGGDWIVPTDVTASSREEDFDYYGFKGTYRMETINTMERANTAPENIQTVITRIEGTTIVLQAPLDALTKDEMLAILPSLKELPPTANK